MLYKGFTIVTGTAEALSGEVIYKKTFVYDGERLVHECDGEERARLWADVARIIEAGRRAAGVDDGKSSQRSPAGAENDDGRIGAVNGGRT